MYEWIWWIHGFLGGWGYGSGGSLDAWTVGPGGSLGQWVTACGELSRCGQLNGRVDEILVFWGMGIWCRGPMGVWRSAGVDMWIGGCGMDVSVGPWNTGCGGHVHVGKDGWAKGILVNKR